jgi:predicted secreted protein
MSLKQRYREIEDMLESLHHRAGALDGSNSFGFTTPEMDEEYARIQQEIAALNEEAESIRRQWGIE